MVVWELFLGIGILGSRKSVIQTVVLWPGFVPKWICQIVHLTKWSYCQLKNLQIIHNMSDWKLLIVFHFKFLITTQICSKYVQKVQRCMSSSSWSSAYLSWKIGNILLWFQFSNSSELKLKYVSDSLSMKSDINDQVLHFSSQNNNNNKTMKRASIFDISWSPSCPPFCYIFYYQKKTFTNFALLLIDIVLKLLHFFLKA